MFDYPTPFNRDLKDEYESMWRFDDEIIDATLIMFSHPKANKHYYKMCRELMTRGDANDMLKAAWRLYEEFRDHPARYGGSFENMSDQITVSMWRVFASLHHKARKDWEEGYLSAPVGTMRKYMREVWMDKLVACNPKPMPKAKQGVGRASLREGGKYFEYLCSLE